MAARQASPTTPQSREVTPDDVQRLAQILGLPIGSDDLAEVTYRLGALVEELEKLSHLPLTREEPIPLFPVTEEPGGG
jgi:hypothetical protein